ncbi:DUF1476 domain-containing protein [Pararhodospirillum oryzae]|uniref:Aldolase n=1 Tax=Pararhodospirillum oryzae TaxID=478448 RepID=A0A512H4M2_9PROT|nr:DUF1476 domain-containing protein [Pararhodospirillum oryzae]GEO80415.1 hypothetical protein ROR02_05460 [Pararhodospirillum oryzae]
MSDAFTDRERAFEAGHQHEQEVQFKVAARRDRQLGLWAATEMGLEGDAAEAYARALVEAGLEAAGEDGLIARVLADLTAKGVEMTEGRLRIKLDRLRAEAETAVRAG